MTTTPPLSCLCGATCDVRSRPGQCDSKAAHDGREAEESETHSVPDPALHLLREGRRLRTEALLVRVLVRPAHDVRPRHLGPLLLAPDPDDAHVHHERVRQQERLELGGRDLVPAGTCVNLSRHLPLGGGVRVLTRCT